jgi:choline dehydrogenase-like flavoprotein
VELASNDPRRPLRIRQNFFSAAEDRHILRKGMRLVREIIDQKPFDEFRGHEFAPGEEVLDDTGLDAYVNRSAITVHHPLGTCRMGADENAVVDSELRVRGAEGLRVADASVMPDLISGNINAAVVMIAERASDMILGSTLLPPAKV